MDKKDLTNQLDDMLNSTGDGPSFMARAGIESSEEWRKWCNDIPFIPFKSDWEVKVIPPFAGAMARFIVKRGKKTVSVYLDVYDRLGIFSEPYWEIYPYEDDVYRCAMNDVEKLVQKIAESLIEYSDYMEDKK